MEITKQKEITDMLSSAVLSSADDQARKNAIGDYTTWIRTLSDVESKESESRLKREIHDDELLNRRDDMEIAAQKEEETLKREEEQREKEEKRQIRQNRIDNGVKIGGALVSAFGTLALVLMTGKTMKAELNGDMTYGLVKNTIQSASRTLFQIKK